MVWKYFAVFNLYWNYSTFNVFWSTLILEKVKILQWADNCVHNHVHLKVIYHPLYSMNKFVKDKSKLPQDGAQVFPYMGWLAIMWPSERVTW